MVFVTIDAMNRNLDYIELGLENVEVYRIPSNKIQALGVNGINRTIWGSNFLHFHESNLQVDDSLTCAGLEISVEREALEEIVTEQTGETGSSSRLNLLERLVEYPDLVDVTLKFEDVDDPVCIRVPYEELDGSPDNGLMKIKTSDRTVTITVGLV